MRKKKIETKPEKETEYAKEFKLQKKLDPSS
jgi:hypothetical protein